MPQPTKLELADYIRDIPDFPKPGILFRDITPLLATPAAYRQAICQLADPFRKQEIDTVIGIEARGFLFAAPLALDLGARLIPVRKSGKLPYEKVSFSYELEYGSDTLEIHADAVAKGSRVLVVDDLLATGGTAEACCRMVERAEATVAGCAFVIELVGFGGAERISRYRTFSLIKYE